MRDKRDILEDLYRARQKNIAVFEKLAALDPAERRAWRPRQPGDPDVTLLIVEGALDRAPVAAIPLLEEVAVNDAEVMRLSRELIEAARSRGFRPDDLGGEERRCVLLPGGGVLHTYAVKEALALGLTPIVTDRDPECPCAKIPEVIFHEIDCYDVDAHQELLQGWKGPPVIGAFCGGADTHVVVARVQHFFGRPRTWVTRETAETCKDKLLAKQALQRHGVPTPAFGMRYPMMMKPRVGSGSRGVFRVHAPPGHAYEQHVGEELLEGPEQSVEVLLGEGSRGINVVDRYFAWVNDQPLEWGHTNPSRLSEEAKNDLYKLAFSAAHAVGADIGFFKIDSILTKDGPKVLECTPRLSGGFDSQISTPMSSGRNLLRYGLEIACGIPLERELLYRKKEETVTIIHRPELASSVNQKT